MTKYLGLEDMLSILEGLEDHRAPGYRQALRSLCDEIATRVSGATVTNLILVEDLGAEFAQKYEGQPCPRALTQADPEGSWP